jgi:leader peptidase (prepilin peptidase)/N-methyltransferase
MNALLLVFKENPALWLGVVAFMGLTVGSFLNVVIHRLPLMMERAWREGMEELESEASQADAMEVNGDGTASIAGGPTAESTETFNLAVPRSRCPNCGHGITALENIPVISWLMLRGKCSSCATPISARYPAVEFVTMLLSLLVAWHFGPTPQALLGIVATWYLVAMTMIDYDTYLLPDSLTLQLMWIGLLAALVPVFTDLQSAVVGAALGYGILWTIYQMFRLITGKEGMGYGDFKLLAAIGALLGWQVLPTVILLSSLVGAVVGLSLIAFSGRDKSKPIPFGPYLAAAGFIAMLWGEQLTEQYFSLIS